MSTYTVTFCMLNSICLQYNVITVCGKILEGEKLMNLLNCKPFANFLPIISI